MGVWVAVAEGTLGGELETLSVKASLVEAARGAVGVWVAVAVGTSGEVGLLEADAVAAL